MTLLNTAQLYEHYRLLKLDRLRLLDTLPEERFDRITRIARQTYDTDIALISLVDRNRQWFKSCQGISIRSTPRSHAFCDHAIRQNTAFVIEDASNDARFNCNPLVTGEPYIRFYAGVPLREPSGFKVGTLCIIDSSPRATKTQDLEALKDLAMLVEAEFQKSCACKCEPDVPKIAARGHWLHHESAFFRHIFEPVPERLDYAEKFADTDDEYTPQYIDRPSMSLVLARELKSANLRRGRVSVCVLDLDFFREVNLHYGHEVGDRALREVGSRLRSLIGDTEFVASTGGDEFLLVLRDNKTDSVYDRILDSLKPPVTQGSISLTLTGSLGVAVYPDAAADPETLLRHAEQAMCQAKEEGRNQFRVFDVGQHRMKAERLELLSEIGKGLEQNQFELFLQPKICLKTSRVEGFEALIRWHHPKRGLLAPDQFIPIIEMTPLERELGDFVLRSGMDMLAAFREQSLDYSLSLNLSPGHFLDADFLDNLDMILCAYEPEVRGKLILEILETTSWNDLKAAERLVRACRNRGVSVSLDDFGTGFSSLSYFRKLALDEIKIDRSFVMDMLENPEDLAIVESIIALGKRFGRKVVAEGVETDELARKLRDLGCDVGQGYLYSRPISRVDALAWAKTFHV